MANVTTGKPKTSGAMYSALTSASLTIPTSATAAITGFTHLGYVSEDGLVNSNSPESTNIKAWGGDTVLSVANSKEDTFKFTLIEALNEEVLKVVYGSTNVTKATDEIVVKANNDAAEQRAWVIDMVVAGGKAKRIVIPCATITEIGDISYTDEEAVGYEITLTAIPDASGNTHYEYIK